MRAIVFSDSHGDYRNMEAVAERHQKDADVFIFLGDGLEEAEILMYQFREKKMVMVSGNCDWGYDIPDSMILAMGKYKVMITHGHRFCVKNGLDDILEEAKKEKLDIVLYGHTHIPYTVTVDGVHFMNPGSIGKPRIGGPSYGILDINDSGIFMHTAEIGL